jgi:hypothetical protein
VRRLAILTVVAATAATTATQVASPTRQRSACGGERWTVKTLQDRPRLLRAQVTTVTRLVKLRRPRSVPKRRLPFERHLYAVTAAVTYVHAEADGDLQVVLWQIGTGSHLIAESPSPACTRRAVSLRRRQMRTARRAIRICARARVTGVAFWDYNHGQVGVAPNAIELHPILRFACKAAAA